MSELSITIVSAEHALWSGQASMLFARGEQGELGIAPGHTPLLTGLRPGEVRVQQTNGEELLFYVSGGILEVQPDSVTILSDTAERAQDLDEAAALKARTRAEELIRDKSAEIDYAQARAELASAVAQLRAIETLRKKAGR